MRGRAPRDVSNTRGGRTPSYRSSGVRKSNKYTTLELIEDLFSEIQKLSEKLAIIFPERLDGYKLTFLSRLWGFSDSYIAMLLYGFRKNPNKKIADEKLDQLEKIIKEKYGEKASECQKIINNHRSSELALPDFIGLLCIELGHISGDIELTYTEGSEILGFLVDDIVMRITNDNKEWYNPDYKFSFEKIDDMISNLDILFREEAENCFKLIKKYKDLNPDLKEYSLESYNVKNPHYFKEILSGQILKAYLFGFMCADGYIIKKSTSIGLELNVKDKAVLYKFANAIELDLDKCKIAERAIRHIYKGEPNIYYQARLRFGCKPMKSDLINIEFSSSKADRKNIPQPIKDLIEQAKLEDPELWFKTKAGLTALAWLLGFYDGDGSYMGQSGWNSGIIYSANEQFLREIKELFEIKHDVKTKTEPGSVVSVFDKYCLSKGYYYLGLDKELFIRMLNSYKGSLERKRPPQEGGRNANNLHNNKKYKIAYFTYLS